MVIGGFMKKSKLALTSSLLCSLYLIGFLISVLWSMKMVSESNVDNQAIIPMVLGLSFLLILPHLILVLLSTIFGWVGFGTQRSGFILTQAILMIIGCLFWFQTWMFTITISLMGFITYGVMVSSKKRFEESRNIQYNEILQSTATSISQSK